MARVYTFGKYVNLHSVQRQKFEKFMLEPLLPMVFEKGRASQKIQRLTEEEKCGAQNWLSKEGRPNTSGPSSLIMASRCGSAQPGGQTPQRECHGGSPHPATAENEADASLANNGCHSQGAAGVGT